MVFPLERYFRQSLSRYAASATAPRQRRQKRGNNLETTIRNPSLFLFLYFILIYFFYFIFLLWILQLLFLLLVRFASFQREMFSDMQRAPTRHIASSPIQPTSAEISPL